jgi:hypothetical protein
MPSVERRRELYRLEFEIADLVAGNPATDELWQRRMQDFERAVQPKPEDTEDQTSDAPPKDDNAELSGPNTAEKSAREAYEKESTQFAAETLEIKDGYKVQFRTEIGHLVTAWRKNNTYYFRIPKAVHFVHNVPGKGLLSQKRGYVVYSIDDTWPHALEFVNNGMLTSKIKDELNKIPDPLDSELKPLTKDERHKAEMQAALAQTAPPGNSKKDEQFREMIKTDVRPDIPIFRGISKFLSKWWRQ